MDKLSFVTLGPALSYGPTFEYVNVDFERVFEEQGFKLLDVDLCTCLCFTELMDEYLFNVLCPCGRRETLFIRYQTEWLSIEVIESDLATQISIALREHIEADRAAGRLA